MSSGPRNESSPPNYPIPAGYDFRRGRSEDIAQERSALRQRWQRVIFVFGLIWALWGLRQAIATSVTRWQRYSYAYFLENNEWLTLPDAEAWQSLLSTTFLQLFPYVLGPLFLWGLFRLFTRRTITPNERLWIARKNGKIAGWISIVNRANYATVNLLNVLPQHQGRGVGSYLLWRSLQDMQPPIYLVCRPELVTFYDRFGFGPLASSAMPQGSGKLQGMGLFETVQMPPDVHEPKPSGIARRIGSFEEWTTIYQQLWRRRRFRESRWVWLEQLAVVGVVTGAIALILPKLFDLLGLHWIPLFRIHTFGLSISGIILALGLAGILAFVLTHLQGWQEWLFFENDQLASYIHWVDRGDYSLLYALQGEAQYAQQPMREQLLQRMLQKVTLPLYYQIAPEQAAFYRHLGFRQASSQEIDRLELLNWRGFSFLPEGLRQVIARLRNQSHPKLILRLDAPAASALQDRNFVKEDAPATEKHAASLSNTPQATTNTSSAPNPRQRWLAWAIVGLAVFAFVFSPVLKPNSVTAVRAEAQQTAQSEIARVNAIRQQQMLPLGHQGNIAAVAFTDQGKTLAVANWNNGNLEIWDVPGDRLIKRIETDAQGFTAMQMTQDGKTIVAATRDDEVVTYDVARGKRRSRQSSSASIEALAIAPDQKSFITGDADGHLQRWSWRGKRMGRVEQAHRSGIGSIHSSPDGKTLATTGALDSSVKLWELSRKSLKPRESLSKLETGEPVEAIAFSPDKTSLISASDGGHIQRWNLTTGQSQSSFWANRDLGTMALSSDGRTLLTNNYLRDWLYTWDLNTGKQKRSWNGNGLQPHQISPNGQRVVTGEYKLHLIDLVAETPIVPLGGDWNVHAMSVAQKDSMLITTNADHTLRVWDLEKKRYLRSIPTGPSDIRAIASLPNSSRVIIGRENGTVQLWNYSTGQANRFSGKHKGTVRAIAVSPDGRLAFSVAQDDATVRLWDLKTNRQLDGFKTNSTTLYDLAISPNGKTLYSSGVRTVEVWDIASGKRLKTIPSHTMEVEALAVSPNGKYLVTGGSDRIDLSEIWVLKVWDLATGQRIKSLKGYSTFLRGMEIADDNETVVFETCCNVTAWNWNSNEKKDYGEALKHHFALGADGKLVGVGRDRETIMVTQLKQ